MAFASVYVSLLGLGEAPLLWSLATKRSTTVLAVLPIEVIVEILLILSLSVQWVYLDSEGYPEAWAFDDQLRQMTYASTYEDLLKKATQEARGAELLRSTGQDSDRTAAERLEDNAKRWREVALTWRPDGFDAAEPPSLKTDY